MGDAEGRGRLAGAGPGLTRTEGARGVGRDSDGCGAIAYRPGWPLKCVTHFLRGVFLLARGIAQVEPGGLLAAH